jgi:hypothetical protein
VDCSTLPNDWLSANIAAVFKKGDVHAAENYRPVSLTCVSCKILEHIICKHMLKHLENHKYWPTLRLNHGFRSGYSCTTQLLVMTEDLLRSFDNNIQLDMAILDFSKAFDTVPHKEDDSYWCRFCTVFIMCRIKIKFSYFLSYLKNS